MIYVIILLFLIILLIFNLQIQNTKELYQPKIKDYTNLNNYFDKKYLDDFKKYEQYSQTIKIPQGSVTICPSKYINGIPQITWDGYFINNLIIYPKFRKKGYGTKLLTTIKNRAKSEGKLHLISQVKTNNKAAINLHNKNDFFVYFRGLNQDNEDISVMTYYIN